MTGSRTRIVIVHELGHAAAVAQAAAERDVEVVLRSAPGAAAYLGAAVFRHMVEAATQAHPEARLSAVLDCGDAPGLALNALRHGLERVRIQAPDEVRARIADIAAQSGAALDEDDGPVLDLLDSDDPLAACRAWLADD